MICSYGTRECIRERSDSVIFLLYDDCMSLLRMTTFMTVLIQTIQHPCHMLKMGNPAMKLCRHCFSQVNEICQIILLIIGAF